MNNGWESSLPLILFRIYRCLVVVPIEGAESVAVVWAQRVCRVALVALHPESIEVLFTIHPVTMKRREREKKKIVHYFFILKINDREARRRIRVLLLEQSWWILCVHQSSPFRPVYYLLAIEQKEWKKSIVTEYKTKSTFLWSHWRIARWEKHNKERGARRDFTPFNDFFYHCLLLATILRINRLVQPSVTRRGRRDRYSPERFVFGEDALIVEIPQLHPQDDVVLVCQPKNKNPHQINTQSISKYFLNIPMNKIVAEPEFTF